jgi:hypothetical protein
MQHSRYLGAGRSRRVTGHDECPAQRRWFSLLVRVTVRSSAVVTNCGQGSRCHLSCKRFGDCEHSLAAKALPRFPPLYAVVGVLTHRTREVDPIMINESSIALRPNAEFTQICGTCGCVFRVEIESRKHKDDQQMYSCPHCAHHLCRVSSPRPPRITLVTAGRHGNKAEPPK